MIHRKYRTKDELNEYKGKDPIAQVLSIIMDQGWLDEKGVEKIEAKVKAKVNESIEFAETLSIA